MSKREYMLQKGLQIRQLSEETGSQQLITRTTTVHSSKSSNEIAKLRDLCPPGIEDAQILYIIEHTHGNADHIESAISELWENHRGHGAQDDWAIVAKKGKKKNEVQQRTQTANVNDNGRNAGKTRFAGRGRGRGRMSGRGRGRAQESANFTAKNNNRSEENDAEDVDNKDSQSKDSGEKNRVKFIKKVTKETHTVRVTTAPIVNPDLKGAWVKKPNLAGFEKTNSPKKVDMEQKKAESVPSSSESSSLSPASTGNASTSKNILLQMEEENTQVVIEQSTLVSEDSNQNQIDPTVVSPKAETNLENTRLTTTWGSLDVTGTSISDWVTSGEDSAANAWARGSQILNVVQTKDTNSIPNVVPGSPKDSENARNETKTSHASSPKQYLKMGKWDSAVATNLSLQFGSFSFSGSGHLDSSSSPTAWGSTQPSTSTTGVAAASETSNTAWGTQSLSSSPKKTVMKRPLEGDHLSVNTHLHQALNEENSMTRKSSSTSAPPGLSIQSGRLTPKTTQSPQSFAPSAPSPATIPKPGDVKRNTPGHQQSHFQSHSNTQAQSSSKIGIGSASNYSAEFSTKTGLYQSPYGQYSMELVGNRSSSASGGIAQTQITSNNAQKSSTSRTVSTGSAQSPTHSHHQSQNVQMQHLQRQMQAQQSSAQSQPNPQNQQSQQNYSHSQGHQQSLATHFQPNQTGPQSYHPHFAPPPPPGMTLPYNPYNYHGYYQGYGYYQNPQYPQYSPRSQYPPRNSIPYSVDGPIPGFTNPPGPPVSYQDQHMLGPQHEFAVAPQGFGDISASYSQQPSQQQHPHQQNAPQSHGKGNANAMSSNSQRSNMSSYQGVSSSSLRDHNTIPPGPNASGAMPGGSYGGNQHYGWQSYGGQPMGNWNHHVPQGYQQSSIHQQHNNLHQPQSYRQYSSSSGNNSAGNDSNSTSGGHGHSINTWSS